MFTCSEHYSSATSFSFAYTWNVSHVNKHLDYQSFEEMLQHSSIQWLYDPCWTSSPCKALMLPLIDLSVISCTSLFRHFCSCSIICWLLIFALEIFYWSFVMSDNVLNQPSQSFTALWDSWNNVHRCGCLYFDKLSKSYYKQLILSICLVLKSNLFVTLTFFFTRETLPIYSKFSPDLEGTRTKTVFIFRDEQKQKMSPYLVEMK